MVEMLGKAFKILGIGLVIFCVVLVVFQRQMMYFPSKYPNGFVDSLGVIQVDYRIGQYQQKAYYVKTNKKPPKCLWVMFGGNAQLALSFLNVLPNNDDMAYLLIDYPGYGNNEGSPSMALNQAAAINAYEAWKNLGDNPKKLGVVGHSLGTAIATGFAAKYQADVLILMSPFTSIKAMANRVLPGLGRVLSPFIRDQYDVGAVLSQVDANDMSVYVYHGAQDDIVPVSMSRELAERYDWVNYTELPFMDHNSIIVLLEKILVSKC